MAYPEGEEDAQAREPFRRVHRAERRYHRRHRRAVRDRRLRHRRRHALLPSVLVKQLVGAPDRLWDAADGHGAVDGPELDLREPALLEDIGYAAARRQRRTGRREPVWLHAQKDQ